MEMITSRMKENRLARWRDRRIFCGKPPYGYEWNRQEKRIEIVAEQGIVGEAALQYPVKSVQVVNALARETGPAVEVLVVLLVVGEIHPGRGGVELVRAAVRRHRVDADHPPVGIRGAQGRPKFHEFPPHLGFVGLAGTHLAMPFAGD